ncbi:N-acetylmuramoyl-L-alanine amidase [Pseudooceanicola sp. CBS1P-1]|uniref:N-acetylmuramoyl-L-alanine amidase n=2 Tax=Paracoccaceae TaxID=31989 RepID=A0A6L7FZS8_9RHOB|nr:N-acetylmuramoyl-L-alanine amidase [Pseudooceanicola endophyticus]MXN17179.1 AMIN domain-containing protein [Pseudooceanicola albus]
MLWLLICLLLGAGSVARAESFSARASVDLEQSRLRSGWGGLDLTLTLSQGVPWRLYTLADPRRIVLDLKGADWPQGDLAGLVHRAFLHKSWITALRLAPARPGWSRLELTLRAPLVLESGAMQSDPGSGTAVIRAHFATASASEFAARAGPPADVAVADDTPARVGKGTVAEAEKPLRILLDPGHGGVDPGAERAGVREADLMLRFALELQEVLRRTGAEVFLTRNADTFVSLEGRVQKAHALGADLMISLHADALAEGEGEAEGITLHTLARSASDRASALLAERHGRGDILAGVDLSHSDDQVAGVLLDLARQETQPRSEALAGALVNALRQDGLPLNARPRRAAAYAVLKAADVPAVLIETGFLSSERDRANLLDPAFRARLAGAIRDGVMAWARADAAAAPLRRQ